MNCEHVRAVLAVIRPDSRDGDLPEFASEMLHLGQCADCRSHFEAQQLSDRELGRAMRNVSVPADLNARLLAGLTAAIAPPTVEVRAAAVSAPIITAPEPVTRTRQPDHAWTRRRAATVVSAAMMLLALGGWWLFQSQRQPHLSVNDLVALCHQPTVLKSPGFQASFRPDLPVTEIRMPARLQAADLLSLQDRGQEIGAILSYPVPMRQRKSVSVVLVVIDLKRVQISNLAAVGTSFQTADVVYPNPNGFATRVWRVDQNLYVCYVQSRHPEDLDSLKTRLQTS